MDPFQQLPRLPSPDEIIARLRDDGYLDDEIIDTFSRLRRAVGVSKAGHLEWRVGLAGTMQQRRVLREYLADDASPVEVSTDRKAGRPTGTVTHEKDAIVAKYRELRSSLRRRPRQHELADNLVPRIEVRTLRNLLTIHKLNWPIE